MPNTQRAALVQLGDLTTYDSVKQHLLREGGMRDGYAVHALSSLCAAVMAATLGTPADVVKTRMMNQPHTPDGRGTCMHPLQTTFPIERMRRKRRLTGVCACPTGVHYHGSLHCVRCIIKEEGVSALWRGTFLNWLRMAPWSLTFYISFEQLRKLAGLQTF